MLTEWALAADSVGADASEFFEPLPASAYNPPNESWWELFDPPIDRRELVRHCTLSEADIAMIRRCRGDHSRLGYALMLCYLRYPARPLRIDERAPAALI